MGSYCIGAHMDEKFKTLDLIQGSEDWLEMRKRHLTATEVAHLKSGYSSLYELISLKRGLTAPKDLSSNPAVKEGVYFEPLVRKWLETKMGLSLSTPCCQSFEEPFFMASLDGYTSNGIGIVFELKNVFSKASSLFEEVKAKGFESSKAKELGYYYQLQWQLMVTQAKLGFLVFHHSEDGKTLNPNNILILKVQRDEKVIAELKELGFKVKKILDENLEVKPQKGDVVAINEDQLEKVDSKIATYKAIDEAYKNATELVNKLKAQRSAIIADLEDALLTDTVTKVQGEDFCLSRSERRGSLDVEAMIKDGVISAEVAEKYRKKSTFITKLTLS